MRLGWDASPESGGPWKNAVYLDVPSGGEWRTYKLDARTVLTRGTENGRMDLRHLYLAPSDRRGS